MAPLLFCSIDGHSSGRLASRLLNPDHSRFSGERLYCAAYVVDIPLQFTFATWRNYRWALLLIGTLLALLVENYWIAGEINPFVSK